jgi:putative transcriptional regulator
MSKIVTSGKRILKGDAWHDDTGPIAGYPDQWDPPMTDEERHVAALSDPDNPPMTADRLARMQRISRAKFVRQKLGLSVAEFSERFGIPMETLQAWERHQAEPDAAALAYLSVIEHAPEVVREAVARGRAA